MVEIPEFAVGITTQSAVVPDIIFPVLAATSLFPVVGRYWNRHISLGKKIYCAVNKHKHVDR